MFAFSAVPVPVQFAWLSVALAFSLLALYRFVFWAMFRGTAPGASRRETLQALWLGWRFDLRLALFLALPALALSWLPGAGPLESPVAATAWWVFLSGTWLLITFIYLVDLAHYDYLHSRLDATAVEHLEAPSIALRTAWESFPIARGLMALVLLTLLQAALAKGVVLGSLREAASPVPVTPEESIVIWGLTIALFAWGIHGRLAKFPLRWSDAFFSTTPFVAALGLNPVLMLFSTWDNRRMPVDEAAVRELYPDLAGALGVEEPDVARVELARTIRPRLAVQAPPNIVIVIVESFAAYKTGAFGNPLNPTPAIDALARDSLLFTDFFAVTAPTARAIFTLLTGIPDVNAVHSASRNPMLVRQNTLANAFPGFETLYFIGGSASWGNIRGVLAHNIPGIRIYEESDFDAPRVDGWGISDRQLFASANRAFSERTRPFLALVHTSGNHRPWTIPRDRGDFEPVHVDDATLRHNGFDSLAEFNSFRFMDHSLGSFFDAARREPWFDNTLFFVLGDHGAGAPHDIPWERLGLTHVHTPLLLHGPRRLLGPARRLDTVMSSLDVLPTALSLAGISCTNATLGADVFDGRAAANRLAFVRRPPCYGLVSEEFFLRFHGKKNTATLHRHRSDDPCRDVSREYPAEATRMLRLCRAYYETARFLLQRNRSGAVRVPSGEPARAFGLEVT